MNETVAPEADVVEESEVKEDARVEEVDGRDMRVKGNDVSGYLGVSPEYMTYANETERPILTDQEKWDYTDQLDHLEGNMDEDKTDKSETDEDVEKTQEEESDATKVQTPSHNAPVSVPGVVVTPTV